MLPDGSSVPKSFHITEVGMVTKRFIDCGGKVHQVETCQLQVWIGEDIDHRIETRKMAQILEVSGSIIADDSLEIEIEYEERIISQYPVKEALITEETVTLVLSLKHTDCLAKDLCGTDSKANEAGCCGGGSCC